MAIYVKAGHPWALLQTIQHDIAQGHIESWEFIAPDCFLYSPQEWRDKACLKAVALTSQLRFGIVAREGEKLTNGIYSVYHARFIEMLLAHYSDSFVSATVSAQYLIANPV